MSRIILFFLLFYILALVQISFFAHFPFLNGIPNILIVFVFLLNLFENADSRAGMFAACVAGFFLDVFSQGIFGFWIGMLFAGALLIKFLKRNYVRLPIH